MSRSYLIAGSFILIGMIAFIVMGKQDIVEQEIIKNRESILVTSESVSTQLPDIDVKETEESNEHYAVERHRSRYENDFQNSDDFYALAIDLKSKALNGDGEAAYMLSRVLLSCEGIPELEEFRVRQDPPETAVMMEYQDIYIRLCSGFESNGFGETGRYEEWLKRASETNYPPAMIIDTLINTPNEEDPIKWLDKLSEEKWLAMFKSINEGSYETIDGLRGLSASRSDTELGLRLLACDFGKPCKGNDRGYWRLEVVLDCSLKILVENDGNCEPNASLQQFIRTQYGEERYEAIQKRKEEIKKLIEYGISSRESLLELIND
ncbi:hypothetical protein [Pleionea sp. CnH1-48]|uniref:hypothetical protein n=1 Tax=Pleionea sp. CnH1-48 TaxID=2954494 RepID=UPI0020974EB1|nr:hypothetical protein [Pleionea sp. CnH1-48]MCO7224410.1 hypothetical protein [Pleionea sp. CnH1-48]